MSTFTNYTRQLLVLSFVIIYHLFLQVAVIATPSHSTLAQDGHRHRLVWEGHGPLVPCLYYCSFGGASWSEVVQALRMALATGHGLLGFEEWGFNFNPY